MLYNLYQVVSCQFNLGAIAISSTDTIFNNIVVILILAVLFGLAVMGMRQPLIVGFIVVGMIIRPYLIRQPVAFNEISFLSELGISLLLFVVGLKLDLRLIRSIGKVATLGGVGQVLLTTVLGYLLCLAMGISGLAAVYISICLAFSSTIIIVKLLSDKGEADSLYGRITVGILIMQDILVVLAMILITSLTGSGQKGNIAIDMLLIIGKGFGLLAVTAVISYYIIPRLFSIFAKSPELLILASISWALSLAFASEYLGFSKEVGAFLAGVAIASTEYREIISARLVTLRDFMLLFFFVDLGMKLDLNSLSGEVWKAVPLIVFVVIMKPLITAIILQLMGYRKRTSILSGIMLGQVSEFSLILAALGLSLGHIPASIVAIITLTGIITIGISSYMIIYANDIYQYLSPFLTRFNGRRRHREEEMDADMRSIRKVDVILFGLGRYGSEIAKYLIKREYIVLGVDFNPQVVKDWNARGGTAYFGDAEDQEFPAMLPLSNAEWVVSAIGTYNVNVSLIKALKYHNFSGNIAVTSRVADDVDNFRKMGANLVFLPHKDAAIEAANSWINANNRIRRERMDKEIASMKDHYIVCGYGRMGQQIVRDFNHHNIPYVVIESNPQQIPKLQAHNIPYVEGKASDDDVLLAAGIERAKGLIAVNPTDEENVFIVLTARGLNPNLYIVARSILQENEDKLKRAGANRVMSPYILGGNRMALAVLHPEALELFGLQLDDTQIQIEVASIKLPESSCVLNRTISDSQISKIPGVAIIAIKAKDGKVIVNPPPDHQLKCDDEIIIAGTVSQIEEVQRLVAAQI